MFVFPLHPHFLQLYNTWFTIPGGSVDSVPLFRLLTFYFPSQSPPFSSTIDEYNSDWIYQHRVSQAVFGATLFRSGDLCGKPASHNSSRCRRPVRPNECDHNITMQAVMHALALPLDRGGRGQLTHH